MMDMQNPYFLLGSLAAEVVEKSIINAIKNAKNIKNIISYNELENDK